MVIKPFKLSDAMKKELIDLEEEIQAIKFEIARAKRAGLDVKILETDLEKALKIREGILREYS